MNIDNELVTLRAIKQSIKLGATIENATDLLDMLKNIYSNIETECEQKYGNKNNIYALCRAEIKQLTNYSDFGKRAVLDLLEKATDDEKTEQIDNLYHDYLLFEAPHLLDSFMMYMEKDRPLADRFYQPRRKIMIRLVNAIQKLADDELDELFLSMPPRVGKSTILTFTTIWWAGRNPEQSNLYSAYSDTITSAFYNGCLEFMQDPVTYKYAEIFPESRIVATNSKKETIDLKRKKKYKSITCRSLYGTLNGACDCNGIEISDDLLSGIEEALNPDRLDTAWSKVDNNFLPRAKMSAKILWCGTRWSIRDPAGIRMDLLVNDDKFKDRRFEIVSLPALDENDESNFNFDFGVGFDTEYYHQRRASFERTNDMASWFAQYMQEPIEREGTLFESGGMNYYNGVLPDGEPDRVFMAVDVAFGGGDFTAGPIAFQYGDRIYIHDVVYNDGDKGITRPIILKNILHYGVQAIDFEENKSTDAYHEWIRDELKKRGYKINLTHHPASSQQKKDLRIRDQAPYIRELYFREDGCRSKEYQLFMQNVFSFKVLKKNKHDDAPDSLAMLIDMTYSKVSKAAVIDSPI